MDSDKDYPQVTNPFLMQPSDNDHSTVFSKRPYLDRRIDSWKLFFLSLLFIILLVGALTWGDGPPWSF